MTAQFELINYEDRTGAGEHTKVYVTDAGPGYDDMVCIRIGNEGDGYVCARVRAKEIAEAANRCTKTYYPYV